MAKRTPTLKTGVDIWSYFAVNLYSHAMLPIVLRELFQNAWDACRQTGREPDINIHVSGGTKFRYGKIICEDNGIGMDEDTILDELLCLGGSNKSIGDTGGFGIGKAVLLGGCTDWEISTQNLYVSRAHIRDQREIDVTDPLQGTKVVLHYASLPEHDPRYQKLRFSPWSFVKALSWLAHSDASCHVTATREGEKTCSWDIPGLHVTSSSLVAEGEGGRTSWELHQVPALDIPSFEDRKVQSAGTLFIRLNGLVQFSQRIGEHPDAWVLDVTTGAQAQAADYPFSLSREELDKGLMKKVGEVLDGHKRNPVTSHRRQFRVSDAPNTVYYEGASLRAFADQFPGDGNGDGDRHERTNGRQGGTARRASVFDQTVRVTGHKKSPIGIRFQVKGVQDTQRNITAPHNLRLLAIWGEVLTLIMEANDIFEEFGVGFAFDVGNETFAERVEENDGEIFYLINPRSARLAVSRPRETLIKMFGHGAHEVAHSRYSHHGEYHSSYMGFLIDAAAGKFAQELRRLEGELSGQRQSAALDQLQMQMPLA